MLWMTWKKHFTKLKFSLVIQILIRPGLDFKAKLTFIKLMVKFLMILRSILGKSIWGWTNRACGFFRLQKQLTQDKFDDQAPEKLVFKKFARDTTTAIALPSIPHWTICVCLPHNRWLSQDGWYTWFPSIARSSRAHAVLKLRFGFVS